MIGLIPIRAERISLWRQELNQAIQINTENTVAFAAHDKLFFIFDSRSA